MACVSLGPYEVKLSQDETGHRTFIVQYKVKGTPGVDGAYAALNASGLPITGQLFGGVDSTGVTGDVDPCAWCRPTREVSKHPDTKEGEAPEFHIVTCTFSSKPQEGNKERCDLGACSPLDEPQGITLDFSNFTEEASYDRFGRRILSSSHEPIHGPNNEWEWTRTTITIEQKVADLQLDTIEAMKDTLNVFPLWGFPSRTIKFKPGTITRHFRISSPEDIGTGDNIGECNVYWTRRLIFEIRCRRREGMLANLGDTGSPGTLDLSTLLPAGLGAIETWDRDVWDEGTKVLRGRWTMASGVSTGTGPLDHWQLIDIAGASPDPDNPQHFIKFKDINGENQKTLLDGAGKPAFVAYIEYQWFVYRYEYLNNFLITGGGPFTEGTIVNYQKVRIDCRSALAYVQRRKDDPGASGTYSLLGPFADEAAAQSAIDAEATGPEVTTCPAGVASAGVIHIEKYGQSDFRLLGIPLDLNQPTPPFTY